MRKSPSSQYTPWYVLANFLNKPWSSRQKTSFPTFQRTCDGTYLYQRHPNHCACHLLFLRVNYDVFRIFCTDWYVPARIHFCELAALEMLAKGELGSTVPRNTDLYYNTKPVNPICSANNTMLLITWFMPALANKRVGSSWGMVEEDGTNVCPCFWTKKSMKVDRTLLTGHSSCCVIACQRTSM